MYSHQENLCLSKHDGDGDKNVNNFRVRVQKNSSFARKARAFLIFVNFPESFIKLIIKKFIDDLQKEPRASEKPQATRTVLPFRMSSISQYYKAPNIRTFSLKISVQLSPVFTNRKLNDDLKPLKRKSALVNKQKVVYHFEGDQCEAGYVSYTSRHLHQRVDEHGVKTTIGEHKRKPGSDISSLPRLFSILRKCKNK